MSKLFWIKLDLLLFRRNYKMKKTMITTAALGLLAVTASGSMVSADMISGTTNKTDVTLTEGSGTDVTPVVPDDTHDDDPSRRRWFFIDSLCI